MVGGEVVVVATGMATELGKIASLIDSAEEPKTPLQRRLAVFGQRLAIAVLVVCAIVFAVGLLRGEPVALMFLTSVSLAVAAVPEALPAVVTILLALGARKMAQQQALIRRLPAVETLGSVTYICSDKTGTLTQNKMRLEEAYAAGALTRNWRELVDQRPWQDLFRALALSNDATLNARNEATGDPTEIALFLAAEESGLHKSRLEAACPRVMEFPFDSERKRMTTIHRDAAAVIAYTKGAPESVLERCTRQLSAQGDAPLQREAVRDEADRMAAEGLRVLAVAQRRWPALPEASDAEAVENELTFIGLVGLMDPPAPGGQAGGGAVQIGGHRSGDDHGRPCRHRPRHRCATGRRRRRRFGADGCSARADAR